MSDSNVGETVVSSVSEGDDERDDTVTHERRKVLCKRRKRSASTVHIVKNNTTGFRSKKARKLKRRYQFDLMQQNMEREHFLMADSHSVSSSLGFQGFAQHEVTHGKRRVLNERESSPVSTKSNDSTDLNDEVLFNLSRRRRIENILMQKNKPREPLPVTDSDSDTPTYNYYRFLQRSTANENNSTTPAPRRYSSAISVATAMRNGHYSPRHARMIHRMCNEYLGITNKIERRDTKKVMKRIVKKFSKFVDNYESSGD